MILGVLFDLYNTLVERKNPEGKIIRAFKLPCDEHFVSKFICRQVFIGWDSYILNILKGIGVKVNLENRRIVMDIFEKDTSEISVFPGAIEVLNGLKARKLKLGLITNLPNPLYNPPENLLELFDAVVYSYKVGSLKPEKRIFDEAVKQMCLKRQDLVMVGDSIQADIGGARASGIRGVLIDRSGEHMDFAERISCLGELLHNGII